MVLEYSTVFLALGKSRMLEVLAFDGYCRFDTSAFFYPIKRASLCPLKESRSIKTVIFIEIHDFQRPKKDNLSNPPARAERAPCMEKIYGNHRYGNPRA